MKKQKELDPNKEYISWDLYDRYIKELTVLIKGSNQFNSIINIYGIPRGGLVMAVSLSHHLDLPLITDRKEIGMNTLIVDDISDSGKTLDKIAPHNYTTTIVINKNTKKFPTWYIHERKKPWVVFPWETEATTVGDYYERME